MANGKLYVFGGFMNAAIKTTPRSDVYDVASNTWTRIADMPEELTHSAVVVDGDTIFVLGGYVGDHPGPSTTRVLKYSISQNSWSNGIDLPQPRGGGAAAIVNREIHYFGGGVRAAGTTDVTDYGDHWILPLDGGTSWQSRAPLPNPRNHLGGIALNGKVYAIGGQHGYAEGTTNQVDVHVYDSGSNSWSEAADMPLGRGHITSSVVVLNERIVVLGGSVNDGGGGAASADVLSYDPGANIWTKLTSLPRARKSPVAGVTGNVIISSTGGEGSTKTTWSGVYPNNWEMGPQMPVALGEVAAGIIGSSMYMVGEGNSATLAYNLSTGTWTNSGPTRPHVGHHHAAEVINNKLYLFGGLGGNSSGKVQIYDPSTNTWSHGAAMPFAAGSSSSAIIGGLVYVAGGIIGSTTTTQAAVYNPTTNSWSMIAPMKQGRNHAASATDGSKLYVFGGRGPGSGDANTVANGFDTVQIYDPTTNTWASSLDSGSTISPLPQARGGMGKAVFSDGEFYVFGGETQNGAGATSNGVYNRVDVYNPRSNSWRLAPEMPTARHGIFPLLRAGRIYLPGGGVQAGHSSSTVLEIYTPSFPISSPPPPPPPGPAHALPGIIQAEDFKSGGQNVGYVDTTAGNTGGQYRPVEDVDIQVTADSGGGYNVGWIRTGEWLAYDVSVAASGSYTVSFRVATPNSEKSLRLERLDGTTWTDLTGTVAIPNTGSWTSWQTVTSGPIALAAGTQTVRVFMPTDGFNLNHLTVATTAVDTITLPGTVQAEDFRAGGPGVGYSDTTTGNAGGQYRTSEDVDIQGTLDSGGGYNVGWVAASEWLVYDVSVVTAGSYTVSLRVATPYSSRSMHLELDGQPLGTSVALPNTGGWQVWQTVTIPALSLSAGTHELRVVFDTPSINFNFLTIEAATTDPPPSTPSHLRINTGGPAVTTSGVDWNADQYFAGNGKSYQNSSVTSIANTTDGVLYLTERSATTKLGSFSYSIPVPESGTYEVRLHFAEIYWGATGGGSGGTGKRVFSVNIESGPIELNNYDINADVGPMTAVIKTFVIDVTDGALDLAFTAIVDQPKVSAIEVVRQPE